MSKSDIPRITPEEIKTIKDAQAGSMKAFNCLFYRYKGFVESLLFRFLNDMDEAKDLTNIVFLKVYDKLSQFTAYDSFGGWLRILTNHTAIDYLRSRKNKSEPDIKEDRLSLDMAGSTENDLVNHLTYKQLTAEFNKLPEDVRRIFEMFYVDNLKVDEISKSFNPEIPTGTIKSTLSRTRRKLKQKLHLK